MKPVKMRITENQSPEAIQNCLFAHGFKWHMKGANYFKVSAKIGDGFYGREDGTICWDEKAFFDECDFEEIFFAHKGEDFVEVVRHSHYFKDVSNLSYIDVYRTLSLFNVTDPCLQHAIKKLLVAGGRGAGKDICTDVQEAIDSLNRWKEMQEEDKQ